MPNYRVQFKYIIGICLLWFIAHTIFIINEGIKKPQHKADIAVILGNTVNSDGTLSRRLTKRLECGLMLFNTHQIDYILVSGGLGKEGFFEGDKMRDYLVLQGVPTSKIIVDNQGNNTLQTVKNTRHLQQVLPFNRIIIVSQYYHISRTKMLFRKFGFKEIESASPNYVELRDVYSILREFIAYYQALITL